MSYRIIYHRDSSTALHERAYILDEQTGKIVAEVVQLEGCKPLVELANRAAAEAVEAAKKRTEAAGAGGGRLPEHES
jgi:hypothetical protein